MSDLGTYRYRGARALVLLHETHLRSCIATWKKAKAHHISLPETTDPNYESLETLLHHILRAARGYMTWICKNLELPDPEIREVPAPDSVEAEVDGYLEHLLARWRLPLADVPEDNFGPHSYISNWGEAFSIDSMLEHAVMHPIRHQFQLEALLVQQS